MQTTIELELRIIIGLIGLIAGFVPGIFMGVHLMTRNYLMHLRTSQRRVVSPRPRPQARTQVLDHNDYYDRY